MARAKSLPSRERGLKFPIHYQMLLNDAVAPLAGAWIEMLAGIASAPKVACRSPRGSVD